MGRDTVAQILIDLETGPVSMSIGLLVPLASGSTLKNVVIFCVVLGLVGG